ncbi:hypothetical protein [Flavobacterium piscis]|uniref:DUF4251 domain-containing protein n=1 Tax=Flavobacterium piscis TaxID=1114874 RepID=A0ABU1Y2C3_9FLAO|nr:hypothetical protein [Flavobacterium piscis]MDR7208374.1 hypothetical protein [Flavobacterium piscis]
MNHFYKLLFLLLFTIVSYGQKASETYSVDKAWLNESEEWSDFTYQGKIIVSKTVEEGGLRIANYDFLYDFCEGRAKFVNKATYSTAEFSHPRKISSTTDKQGIANVTYEGMLIFQSDKDYYSVIAVITILEKNDKLLGLKMHLKDKKREYAFSFKPNS